MSWKTWTVSRPLTRPEVWRGKARSAREAIARAIAAGADETLCYDATADES